MKSWLEQRAGWGAERRRAGCGRCRIVSMRRGRLTRQQRAGGQVRRAAGEAWGLGARVGRRTVDAVQSAAGGTAGRNSSDGRTAAEREAWAQQRTES
jgi:hypothetical protein